MKVFTLKRKNKIEKEKKGRNWKSPYQNVKCGLSLGNRIMDGFILSFEIFLYFTFPAMKVYNSPLYPWVPHPWIQPITD